MILLIAALLSSCTQDEPYIIDEREAIFKVEIPSYTESEDNPLPNYILTSKRYQYYDGCLYFMNGASQNNYVLPLTIMENYSPTTLVRMNIRTGNITTLCPDPLCMHTTVDCPFSGVISYFYIEDGIVLYHRRYQEYNASRRTSESVRQICTYDIANMKMTVLKEEEIVSTKSYAEYAHKLYNPQTKQYYYCDYAYNEEQDVYQWAIMRMDITTGKEEILIMNEAGSMTERYLFLVNDRIYFTDTFCIYSTDLDLNDKQVHLKGNFPTHEKIYTNGKFIFYSVQQEDESFRIYRVDMDGQNCIDLQINTITDWLVTEKYIYFMPPNWVSIPSTDADIHFYTDKIYRCNHDGSNQTLVVKTEYGENGNYLQINGLNAIGNYLYCNYYTFTDLNSDGICDIPTEYLTNYNTLYDFHFLRIDTTTGEMVKLYVPDV